MRSGLKICNKILFDQTRIEMIKTIVKGYGSYLTPHCDSRLKSTDIIIIFLLN